MICLLNGTFVAPELKDAYKKCVQILDDLDIPYGEIRKVTVNTRAKRRWGQCKTHKSSYEVWSEISISSRLLAEGAREGLENTILHEMIHTCPDCKGHDNKWTAYADKVNRAYGYNIKRTSSDAEKGVEPISYQPNYRYVLQCENGHTFRRQRMSDFVKRPGSYKCGCGGKITRIQ